MRRSPLSSIALLFLASIASAQTVWTVGPPASGSDFTVLQIAVDTVADGDVLLVRTGNYQNADVVGKGLTIVADAGATPVLERMSVTGLPSGKSVRFQGLNAMAIHLTDCVGTAWIESCVLSRPGWVAGSPTALRVTNSSSVALLDVTANGGPGHNEDCLDWPTQNGPGSGLQQVGSSVHAYGCSFRGGRAGSELCDLGICKTQEGAWAIRLSTPGSNLLMLSDCQLLGGECSSGWFSDCQGLCPGGNCAGGGLYAYSGTTHVLESQLAGAPGADCSGWGPPPQAPAYVGPVAFLPGTSLLLAPLEPVRENTTVPIHVEGPPHALVRLGSSDRSWTFSAIEIARGTSFLAPSPAATVRTLGVTDANGMLDTTLDVGALPPGDEAGITFFQPYYVLPERHKLRRIGAPIEDVVLGQATMLVVLDESL